MEDDLSTAHTRAANNKKDAIINRIGLSDVELLDTLFTNVKIGPHNMDETFSFTDQRSSSSLGKDVFTVGSGETADRTFNADPKRKIAVTAPSTSADSVSQSNEKINHSMMLLNV